MEGAMTVHGRREFVLPDSVVRIRATASTDRGTVRAVNEDASLVAGVCFVVADGMGGHEHGDLASAAAVGTFRELIADDAPARAESVLDAIAAANRAVVDLAVDRGIAGTCGTTLTGVALVDVGDVAHWMAFNVGDSRVYQWNGRRLDQLTVDHSDVQERIDRGELTELAARTDPRRNIVTRALGADDDVDPDVWIMPARARQTFLVCSDGLTRELDDDEIARIITFHDAQSARESPPMSLAARLVGAAVAAGGKDNVTVIVVESELDTDEHDLPVDPTEDTSERGAMSPVLEDTLPRS
jgi:serine/threonine protein phosphatase PrpC